MSMIFPGMDPYLEKPALWHGFHQRLLVYVADHLQPQLRPRYVAAVEERVYVEGTDRQFVPDAVVKRPQPPGGRQGVALAEADAPDLVCVSELEIHENYLNILDLESNQTVITVVEIVSPSNKYAGPGRDSYTKKQREVRQSTAHLVEIDLLRAGPHVLAVPEYKARGRGPYDYLTCVNRAWGRRDEFELYRRRVRERLPRMRVPLAGDDPDVVLDLQAVIAQAYEAGAYRDRLNYNVPCVPPLPPEDQEWANQLIRAASSPPS